MTSNGQKMLRSKLEAAGQRLIKMVVWNTNQGGVGSLTVGFSKNGHFYGEPLPFIWGAVFAEVIKVRCELDSELGGEEVVFEITDVVDFSEEGRGTTTVVFRAQTSCRQLVAEGWRHWRPMKVCLSFADGEEMEFSREGDYE